MNELVEHMDSISIDLIKCWKQNQDTSWVDFENLQNHKLHPTTGFSVWKSITNLHEIRTWMANFHREKESIVTFEEKDENFYLFSPGSSASRNIAKHYNLNVMQYCTTGLEQGHMAHIRDPSCVWNKNKIKALYIASHPIETIISHYLRNIITQGDGAIMAGGLVDKNLEFICRIGGMGHPCDEESTFDQNLERINWFFERYIDFGYDLFRLDEAMSAWNKSLNVYAVKYENFKKEEKKINKWFNKSKDHKELKWIERKSKRKYLSPPVLKKLEKMYEKAIHEYESLGANNEF
tara:strand:+ start:17862 stop:18740 length:879 start_codon:yes stop_codon:yes gene_type:complete